MFRLAKRCRAAWRWLVAAVEAPPPRPLAADRVGVNVLPVLDGLAATYAASLGTYHPALTPCQVLALCVTLGRLSAEQATDLLLLARQFPDVDEALAEAIVTELRQRPVPVSIVGLPNCFGRRKAV